MSLKAFHLFFISVSAIFLISLTLWSLGSYRSGGGAEALVMAAIGIVSAVVLLVYGRWFLRKIQKMQDA